MRSFCSLFPLPFSAPTRETICADIGRLFKEALVTLVCNRKARYGSLMREQRAKLVISNWDEFKIQLIKNINDEFITQCLAANSTIRDKLINDFAKHLALQTGLSDPATKDKIFIKSTRLPSHRFQYFPTTSIYYTLPVAILSAQIDFAVPRMTV